MHRTYENEDLVVFWNSEKCRHAKECVHGSPDTFNPAKKPWIQLGRAENKEVWQAISKCPSGALSCIYRHGITVTMDAENSRSLAFDGDQQIGECEYDKADGDFCIYHTAVREEYKGKGIARRLVYKVIEQAERECMNITATCSYAKKVLQEVIQ